MHIGLTLALPFPPTDNVLIAKAGGDGFAKYS